MKSSAVMLFVRKSDKKIICWTTVEMVKNGKLGIVSDKSLIAGKTLIGHVDIGAPTPATKIAGGKNEDFYIDIWK